MTSGLRQTWHFPAHDQMVAFSRTEAAKTVADWGLASLVDDVTLVVSELVTNAIRHGRPPDEQDITLTLCVTDKGVCGEVCDHGKGTPRRVAADDDTEGGRGLAIVDMLAADWGVTDLPDGKRVWFKLRAEA